MHVLIIASIPSRPSELKATLRWELRHLFEGMQVEIHCPVIPDRHRILKVEVSGDPPKRAKELEEDLPVLVDVVRRWLLEDRAGIAPSDPEAA